MNEPVTNEKAKHSFIVFILGLIVGAWPVRWASAFGFLVAGFVLGNVYNVITWCVRS